MKHSNFEKFPSVKVAGYNIMPGWSSVAETIKACLAGISKKKKVIVIECYQGVLIDPFLKLLKTEIPGIIVLDAEQVFDREERINQLVYPFVTDDPVFGYMAPLALTDFFNTEKLEEAKTQVATSVAEIICVYGAGASLVAPDADLFIYADMPRWELQLRFRNNQISNLGVYNANDDFSYQYKRAFFVDWRVLDRHKVSTFNSWDYVLDTTDAGCPKMVEAAALFEGLSVAASQPFRVVPFFDPGPWGGQWLKEVCDLDRTEKNFAWGFDCVPEENSLLLNFDNGLFETPAINLIFYRPEQLLGKKVYEAFGAEFPIRFDFLDTMQGGNLSLQVHPLKEYIREKFGMAYTQDESYYILEAEEGAVAYLGLKEDIVPEKMLTALEHSQETKAEFPAEDYVAQWPIKKHDHLLIPAGTIHCSGANSVVLEISATPYIFTFKLWDWGRLGLDGKPRPISLEHGKKSIQWNRTSAWTKENIINHIRKTDEGDGWIEEVTGLHPDSFIETRRHWFTKKVTHHTGGVVNIINLVEGKEVIVESPTASFAPFVVHYVETFIVPASVGAYTIRPYGESQGQQCVTMKSFVRKNNLIDYKIN